MIAGTSTATYEVKAFLVPGVDRWRADVGSSKADLTIHIDDFRLGVADESFYGCIETMRERASALAQLLQDIFGGTTCR